MVYFFYNINKVYRVQKVAIVHIRICCMFPKGKITRLLALNAGRLISKTIHRRDYNRDMGIFYYAVNYFFT